MTDVIRKLVLPRASVFLVEDPDESSKESRLLTCFPIQLSKNRPRRKGGKIARPLRPCQAECFRYHTKSFRLTRTRVLTSFQYSKDRTAKDCREKTAGTADLTAPIASCQPRVGTVDNGATPASIPPSHATCCVLMSYVPFFRELDRVGTTHNDRDGGAIPGVSEEAPRVAHG